MKGAKDKKKKARSAQKHKRPGNSHTQKINGAKSSTPKFRRCISQPHPTLFCLMLQTRAQRGMAPPPCLLQI